MQRKVSITVIFVASFFLSGGTGALSAVDQGAAASSPRSGPRAWTTHAYGIRGTSAVLAGFINARGRYTTWYFKWGKTKAYGHIVPVGGIEEGFSDSRPEEVEEAVFGLTPGTTYHYRIVAYSHGRKVFGGDKTFKTTR